jgi:hypothetical protein
MNNDKLFWGDLHSNIHHNQIDEMEKWYEFAKEVTDFWAVAYYPYYMKKLDSGLGIEDIYDKETREKDWEIVKEFCREKDSKAGKDGNIPVFAGYEWQGSGLDGDHNVFYLENNGGLFVPLRYEELCSLLPLGKAIAIPHHPAYALGNRGKNWETHNPLFSPFSEIFSSHGSSESGYTDMHMLRHIHMGPRTGGTSVFDGLLNGHETGIIASGDNHSVPAMYGHGLMACYSEDNTKEKIWEAMLKKHVYGVTGNKIKLKYNLNDAMMGDKINQKPPYEHVIETETGDALDRIELIRNGILEEVYTHSGKWEEKEITGEVTFKFRTEFGWGPDLRIYPDITKKKWSGSLTTSGEILSIEKCWTSYGQKLNWEEKNKCSFELTTYKTSQSGKWMGPSPVTTESFIFEIKADIDSDIILETEGKVFKYSVRSILNNTQLISFEEESRELSKERFGFDSFYRNDNFHHNAYKVLIHRGTPEDGYKVCWKTVTTDKKKEKDFYLVKVFQRDGNIAWSSPIWVE